MLAWLCEFLLIGVSNIVLMFTLFAWTTKEIGAIYALVLVVGLLFVLNFFRNSDFTDGEPRSLTWLGLWLQAAFVALGLATLLHLGMTAMLDDELPLVPREIAGGTVAILAVLLIWMPARIRAWRRIVQARQATATASALGTQEDELNGPDHELDD